MLEILRNIPSQPATYLVTFALTLFLLLEAAARLGRLRWAFAALVYATIGLWYLIDPPYRPEDYFDRFTRDEQTAAYIQVIIFLVSFRILVAVMTPATPSSTLRQFDPRVFAGHRIANTLMLAWCVLFAIGVWRMDFRFLDALFPLSGRWDRLWERPRFGGSTGFLVSVGEYSYQIVCAGFGLVAVSAVNRRVRMTMIMMVCLTWPMFLLSGTRHHMLAVGLPSVLAILILKRWTRMQQIAFLAMLGMTLNAAFLIVIEYRNEGLGKFFESSSTLYEEEDKESKHLGLNMPQELMHVMRYQEAGVLDVEWGHNYFAHAVNFIPRAFWPEKPFPGEEFSEMRVGRNRYGKVNATISHGIVGQGVSNFGPWLGPVAPAIILCFLISWSCNLLRQGDPFLRICLILVVMGKIPNLGRDITLFALWPVIFGYIGVSLYEKNTRTIRRNPVRQHARQQWSK